MGAKIYIDGQEGTTGLQIHQRLAGRDEITLLTIDPQLRKDTDARRAMFEQADVAILCLPDEASREAVKMTKDLPVRILDASTAFRTSSDWVYGFAELNHKQRARIAGAPKVAIPGCHATGFVSLIHPLTENGFLSPDAQLSCHSITGFSGGGKKMIAQYEKGGDASLLAPRFYALALEHKHLPEMMYYGGLDKAPVFTPIVSNFYKGMVVAVPLHIQALNGRAGVQAVHALFEKHYENQPFVRVMPLLEETNLSAGFLDAQGCNDTNRLDIFVYGHDEQVLLLARLDNLGKGSSGAAVQCLNLMLGLEETTGLAIN